MAGINPREFAEKLNYETALIETLAALDEADESGQIEARKGISDALTLFEIMTNKDRQHALMCLVMARTYLRRKMGRIQVAMRSPARQEAARSDSWQGSRMRRTKGRAHSTSGGS